MPRPSEHMMQPFGRRASVAAFAVLAAISFAAPAVARASDASGSAAAAENARARGAHAVKLDPVAVDRRAAVPNDAAATPCTDTPVERFYRGRKHAAAWLSRSGAVRRRTWAVLRQLEHADKDALDPQRYDAGELKVLLRAQAHDHSLGAAAALDARITRAVLAYAHDLAAGRVSPARAQIAGQRSSPGIDVAAVLERGIDTRNARRALSALRPPHEGYARLREALARYRAIASAGSWPRIEPREKLEPGKRYPPEVLEALRRRLAAENLSDEALARLRMPAKASGEATGSAASARRAFSYDGAMADAVRRFQGERGIDADGVIGAKTLAELNRPAGEVVRAIELNMERWRWLPRDLGRRHIRADIPSFQLGAYEDGHVTLEMRLIAGEKDWPSPLFSDQIEYVVLNPSWHVPKRIATEEILPRVAEDPSYLSRNGIELVSGSGNDQRVVQPYGVELAPFLFEDFPYRLRQAPGPHNPLGRIKFVMPNNYDVYLHDTPNHSVFARTNRAVSHGCIRVEKPLDLAEWLLRGDQSWDRDKLVQQIDTEARHTVRLTEPVPVHLTYFTAFVDDEGRLELRPDVYAIDEKLAQALHTSAAAGAAAVATP